MLFIKFSSPFHKKSLESYKMFCENEQKHKFSLTIKINLKFFCERGTVFFLSVSVIKLFLHCRVTFVWLGQKESFLHGSFFVKENSCTCDKKIFRHCGSFWSVPNTFTLFYVRMRIYNRGQSSDKVIRKTRDLVCLFSNHCKTNKFNYICSDDPPSPKKTTLRIFGFLYMGVSDQIFLNCSALKFLNYF